MYLFTESYTCARSECCAVFTEYIAGVNDVEFNLSSVQGRGRGRCAILRKYLGACAFLSL